jgi:putative ABC transport system permease protein
MVSFIAAILFISAIFFTAHCGVTYQNFTRNALTYSPYDLFYVQYNDINNMDQKEIMQTLDKYDITITEEKRLGQKYYLKSSDQFYQQT